MIPSYLRQMDMFDPGEHGGVPIYIVGAGMIGSFVAEALGKLGCHDITVYDGDDLCGHNLPNQGYPAAVESEGEIINKALLLQREIRRLCGFDITAIPEFWKPGDRLGPGIVISAVDDFPIRQQIWEQVKSSVGITLFVDGRIGGQIYQAYIISPDVPAERDLYDESFTGKPEELSCTNRSVIDVSYGITQFIVGNIRTWLTDKDKAVWMWYDARSRRLEKREAV